MKTKVIIMFSIIGGLILMMIGAVFVVTHIAEKQMEEMMQTTISELDLDTLEDGVYTGEVKMIPIHVIVDVIISDHQITNIVIVKHRSGQGSTANAIIDDIILNQSLDVDFVTGATYSSHAIIVAIEKALSEPANE